jgi:dolichol kinase
VSEKFSFRLGGLKEEILRKSIHVGSGIVICFLYTIFQRDLLTIGLLFPLFIVFFFEVLRFKGMVSVPFLRGREEKKIGGHAFFMLGIFISILLFDKQIAIASILMLAIGDAASGMALAVKRGSGYVAGDFKRRIKPPGAILIMFGVSLLVGYYTLDSLKTAISGAIGATIADGVHLRVYGIAIDDNFTIPLYSGILMSLVS